MPTGVALRDPRQRLFEAAGRVLVTRGPGNLTSRAVTAEAGCAKGVLHRYFADFDAFLVELIQDRVGRLRYQATILERNAGVATVGSNVADALYEIFDPVALAMVGLVISRDGLRARLRRSGSRGVPVLTEASGMLSSYLASERDRGRVPPTTDVEALGVSLVGAAHLLFAGNDRAPGRPEVERLVNQMLMGIGSGSG